MFIEFTNRKYDEMQEILVKYKKEKIRKRIYKEIRF